MIAHLMSEITRYGHGRITVDIELSLYVMRYMEDVDMDCNEDHENPSVLCGRFSGDVINLVDEGVIQIEKGEGGIGRDVKKLRIAGSAAGESAAHAAHVAESDEEEQNKGREETEDMIRRSDVLLGNEDEDSIGTASAQNDQEWMNRRKFATREVVRDE